MSTTEISTPISRVGWTIDRDYISGKDEQSAVGVSGYCTGLGPGQAFHGDTAWTRQRSSDPADPVRFRLLDGDDIPYFGGSIARSWLDGDEEYVADVLSYGEGWGCVTLEIRDENNEWKAIM